MTVEAVLADRRAYERQIERMHERSLLNGRLYQLRQDEVSLASVVINRSKVAKLMARDVAHDRYELQPGELKTISVKGKQRQVYACRMTDLIIHGVVAELVRQATEAMVSPRVFSYRRGRSPLDPVRQLAAWIRRQRRAHPDPRDRHLYVLRRDVDSYTDAIPVDDGSPLWTMLAEAMGGPPPPLVTQVIRAELRLPDGALACRLTGLPMGQPIAAVVANLYLRDVDRTFQQVPGGFYARYGDDFLFAHPDPDTTREVDRVADTVLDRLRLTVNEKKRRTAYLTPAGRTSSAWPEARGSPYVPFLGTRITATGTVGLGEAKVRVLLRELDRRVRATTATLDGADTDTLGRAACEVVNSALDPNNQLTQQRSAMWLRRIVTDRAQLQQIDYLVARMIVSAITGRRDAGAFRVISYRHVRRRWGLRSLVAARDSVGRARP